MLQLGENLYINPGRGGCTQCHGEAGNAPVMPLYPKIGGQSEIYLYNQLIDYREKRRKNGLFFPMEVAMEPFSDDEIKAMAHYLAAQTAF
ncbi:cytochrome c [Vibrio sinensis]|uniref:Cytochrome c n=2 Tax=Vibrio sinensis TaxID=2302434 RepID=A0A3A6QYE5_9VIBR|nr:cytochrome c [Vibrio sinensis]